jgi:peptide/histidine transporter 3/4
MASLFVEQGAAMKTNVSNLKLLLTSMSIFDIIGADVFIFFYCPIIDSLVGKLKTFDPKGLTKLLRKGVRLVIVVIATVSVEMVKYYRLN